MIYCFLAEGFEELEAIAPIDLLKRAGVEVKTVGVGGKMISGSHGITFDTDLTDCDILLSDNLSGVILPGGMPGTINLENNMNVQRAVDFCAENGKLLCAICAAPSILGHKNLLEGKEAISYPGFEKDLYGAEISKKSVVTSGNIITAKGAGVAVDFGLEIVAYLKGRDVSDKIREQIQCV